LTDRVSGLRRWGTAVWLVLIAGFAVLHTVHLRADFPNGSPWVFDWAKFTDEGWYGNAAMRAHLFGNWYMAGDFNPAPAVPVWPFLEWVLFFFTGVSVQAARGLAVACFFASLALSYLLLRTRGPKWMGLLAATLAVTSPFLYCFSRLAILEPLQTTLSLAALNLAVRLNKTQRPALLSVCIGVLFALLVLTKTTGLFLLPALAWAMAVPLWEKRTAALRCLIAAVGTSGAAYGLWLALLAANGLMGDYRFFFLTANSYPPPSGTFWPLVSFWWSFHGLLWIDHSLVVLAGAVVACAAAAWRTEWARRLWLDPVFGASLLAVAGSVLFMTLHNHPQPRYFAVPAFFCFFVAALGAAALLEQAGWARRTGWAVIAAAVAAAGVHGVRTIGYAAHPEYTWVNAAAQLTHYIDAHPNGKRLMVSISGDEITLITHLPALCDDWGTVDLGPKIETYQPGWYASWNDLDPGTLQDLHLHFSLEQVAAFRAFDDPDRNLLVLFKLHPLANGQERRPGDPAMRGVLPDDEIDVPIE